MNNKRKDSYVLNVVLQEKDMLRKLVINGVIENYLIVIVWLKLIIIIGVTRDGGDFPIYFLTFAGLAATAYFSLVVVPTL